MTELGVIVVIFIAVFVQSIAGFGTALIAMPLLVKLIGLQTALPFFAMLAPTTQFILMIYYRRSFDLRAIWHIMLMTFIGIPIGIWLSNTIDETWILRLVGVITFGYALYALYTPTLPRIHPRWGFGFGFASGLLIGAFNAGGPPYVIYGTSQNWSPAEFKSNLQVLFLTSGLVTITTHAVTGHFTGDIFRLYLIALPSGLLALGVGFYINRYINHDIFRKVVLLLLMLVGIILVLG